MIGARTATRRRSLDAGPLLKYIDSHNSIKGWGDGGNTPTIGDPHAAMRRRLHEARATGHVSFAMADQCCCLLSVHMSEIYGDLYWKGNC